MSNDWQQYCQNLHITIPSMAKIHKIHEKWANLYIYMYTVERRSMTTNADTCCGDAGASKSSISFLLNYLLHHTSVVQNWYLCSERYVYNKHIYEYQGYVLAADGKPKSIIDVIQFIGKRRVRMFPRDIRIGLSLFRHAT